MTQTPTGAHTWLVLWKATRAVEARAFQSIEATGLCASDFGLLEALLHKGPLPVNEIGRRILLESASITAAVDRLERRRLVVRKADPDDRRVRRVTHPADAGDAAARAPAEPAGRPFGQHQPCRASGGGVAEATLNPLPRRHKSDRSHVVL